MLVWQELSQQFQQTITAIVRFAKVRKRGEARVGLAAIVFWVGYSLPKWLTPELKTWVDSWHGLLLIPGLFYAGGLILLLTGAHRIWQLVQIPELSTPRDRPSAIKGSIAFTPADGELFRKLGREDELRKLLGFIEDAQIRLVILMGASGAGKTSLLRAGLTDILKNRDIDYHYWEVVPTSSGARLLRAIQESWQSGVSPRAEGASSPISSAKPESLEDLVNPSSTLGERHHVIVLDQFEQLHASGASNAVLRLLRKVAREARPPHRVTWIVAFRREFRSEWEDLTLPEKERGIYPAEISLRLFTAEQARNAISQLIAEAKLSIQQRVVDNLVEAATVDGEVSPVDIGIGLLVLAELHDRQGGNTVTLNDYHFAGGAEGLLMQYISRCLDTFSEADRQTILNAMLALREPQSNQRIPEGRTCAELALETKGVASRLKTQLERLTQRDVRLLEVLPSLDVSDARYRLPHDRLIPALNRIAGQVLAKVDAARLKFENAFVAWKNNGSRARYLLKPRELRQIERFESQIFWGKDSTQKRAFLHRSQRRRTLGRLGLAAALICLIGVFGVINRLNQHNEDRRLENDARTYLQDNNYPPEMFDWRDKLKILVLNSPMNVQRLPWLRSNILEELTINWPLTNKTPDGLASLASCNSLRKLSVNFSSKNVADLTPLNKLTKLTELTLDLSDSDVSDLTPLTNLIGLTELSLDLSGGKVSDLSPLTKLSGLTKLTLKLSGAKVRDLTPLMKLSKLTQLTLDLSGETVSDLTPLAQSSGLTQLTLDLRVSAVRDLTPLTKLTGLNQLSLRLGQSEVSDLTPLRNLLALTDLTLDISSSKVNDLSALTGLTSLNQLTIWLGGTRVRDLTPVSTLTRLSNLTLDIGDNNMRDFTPLTTLPELRQLSLAFNSQQNDLAPLMALERPVQFELFASAKTASDLTRLTKLTRLNQLTINLRNSEIGDLTPLGKLTNLNQLRLYISSTKVSTLAPLAKLTGLNELALDLSGSKVSDLTVLNNLTALLRLDLVINDTFGGGEVSDLTPLGDLPRLTQLTLSTANNGVSDLIPLKNLSSLTELTLVLQGSQASDLTPLVGLPKLRKLNLYTYSNLSDLSPLTKLPSCQTLVLGGGRTSLKAIPRTLNHLEF